MDMSLISGIASGLSQAVTLARGAVDLRAAQLLAAELSKLNNVLLDSQQRLFSLSAELLALQDEHFETREKLRKMHEAQSQRDRYALVKIGQGQFAYVSNQGPVLGATGDPVLAEPKHYLCQHCWDAKGIKSILVLHLRAAVGPLANCPVCTGHMKADLIRD